MNMAHFFDTSLKKGGAAHATFVLLFKTTLLVGFFLLSAILITGPFQASNQYVALILPSHLVDLTNGSREEEGLSPLRENPLLSSAARLKAEDMAARGYFSHTSPDGLSPWHWFSLVGYEYRAAGENLAVHFESDENVLSAWMKSPSHRANILNDAFTEVGIAAAEGEFEGRKTTFVVQLFGKPVHEALSPVATVSPGDTETKSEPKEKEGSVSGVLDARRSVEGPAMPVITAIEPEEDEPSHVSAPSRLSMRPLEMFSMAIALLAALLTIPLFFYSHGTALRSKFVHLGIVILFLAASLGTYALSKLSSFGGEVNDTAAFIVISDGE